MAFPSPKPATDLSNDLKVKSASYISRARAEAAFLNLKEVQKLLDTASFMADKHNLETYLDTGAYGTTVYLTANGLTGLKDESLAALLEAFVYSEPDNNYTSDSPASFSRSYNFSWYGDWTDTTGHRPSFAVRVTANFKEDSETCKRVIVGYKAPSTEATPIYELQCSDEQPALAIQE